MYSAIVVALIGAFGSCVGTVIGILANTRIINYRLEKLEEKVNKHNSLIDRTYILEGKEKVLEEKIDVANHRIKDLEERELIGL